MPAGEPGEPLLSPSENKYTFSKPDSSSSGRISRSPIVMAATGSGAAYTLVPGETVTDLISRYRSQIEKETDPSKKAALEKQLAEKEAAIRSKRYRCVGAVLAGQDSQSPALAGETPPSAEACQVLAHARLCERLTWLLCLQPT